MRVPPISTDRPHVPHELRLAAVSAVVVAAWVLLVVGQASGNAAQLHQHGLSALGATPSLGALIAFLLAWQVMIAATMLPASLRAIHIVGGHAGTVAARSGLAAFLLAFVAVWTAFGGLAFLVDVIMQRAATASEWLAVRPWLPGAAVVALAAVYQFTPLKRRSLAACRHPARLVADRSAAGATALRLGIEHGLACVGNAWALMAIMVVAGLGDVWWMAALTVVMVYEATGRHGQQAASVVGLLLVWLAVLIALPAWLPT